MNPESYKTKMDEIIQEIQEIQTQMNTLEDTIQQDKFKYIKMECKDQEEISELHADIKFLEDMQAQQARQSALNMSKELISSDQ